MPMTGNIEFGGGSVGDGFDHAFNNHTERARRSDGLGIVEDAGVFLLGPPARGIAAELVHCLWRQADMRHDGHAAFGQEFDRRGHCRAAFEFDRCAAGLGHDAAGAGKGLFGRTFIAAEGHVDDDDAVPAAAHHRRAVRAHHVERDGEGGRETVYYLPQGIADEENVAMRIEQLRHPHGVGGQHDQRFGGGAGIFSRADRRARSGA